MTPRPVPNTGILTAVIDAARRDPNLDLGPLASIHLHGVNLYGTDRHHRAHDLNCSHTGRLSAVRITTGTIVAYAHLSRPGVPCRTCTGFHHDSLTPEQVAYAASLPVVAAAIR